MAIVILAALAWGGYWIVMAQMREHMLVGWLGERRAEGWVADVETLEIKGFPNRLDTFVKGLALADPDQGWSWNAEEFQILSLAWKPHHVIAAWPGEQVIGSPFETVRITSEHARGSVIFKPTPRLELDRLTIELDQARFHGDHGWQAGIEHAVLASEQVPDVAPNAHRIGLDAAELTPPNAWTDEIPGSSALPRLMDTLTLDAVVHFDRPWDRNSIETENPAITAITLSDATAIWGELDLRAKGEVHADANGFAEGEITLRAKNWRQMLEIAEKSGAMKPEIASAVRGGLDLIAMLSGDRETLTVTLGFSDGRAKVGPIPIGTAPRLTRG